jgi:bacterioferritin-associated ferredoxin
MDWRSVTARRRREEQGNELPYFSLRAEIILVIIIRIRDSGSPGTPMYICLCNAITDREIRQCAELGATTLSDLGDALGVATCCGRCADAADRVLRECAEMPPLREAA